MSEEVRVAELPNDAVEALCKTVGHTLATHPRITGSALAALANADGDTAVELRERVLTVIAGAAYPLIAARVRAEAVAAERQRLADVILPEHWQTMQTWGGVRRLACGRCRYGDGVQYLWPCPTRRAITGEPEPEADSSRLAAGSVPVATPTQPEGGSSCSE